jgi:mutator protein MutT
MEFWDIYDKDKRKTGKTVARGDVLNDDEYHLIVFGIICNSNNEFIISKRAVNKSYPETWEFTGGAVICGESSHEAILREVKEELGIKLNSKGILVGSFVTEARNSYYADVWYFEEDIDISLIKCQFSEVIEAKLVDKQVIDKLNEEGFFMPGNNKVYEIFLSRIV